MQNSTSDKNSFYLLPLASKPVTLYFLQKKTAVSLSIYRFNYLINISFIYFGIYQIASKYIKDDLNFMFSIAQYY